MKRFFKTAISSLITLSALFFFSTCEVGLGEAVDNEAPTVSVTGPDKASIHKGAVIITGTCDDDKGVGAVRVVLRNTSTGLSYSYSATIESEAKSAVSGYDWTLTVNEPDEENGTYPLPDGKYVADVTSVDINGRTSGTSSTQFDIDNTAPFFCVTSPASVDISKPQNYGSTVSISGEIADDHDIKNMTIRVFRTNAAGSSVTEITSQLAKTEFTDFETAGGTTIYIAKWFDTEPAAGSSDHDLYQNYKTIYGKTPDKTDVYVYIVPTLTDECGNVSEYCYVSAALKEAIAAALGVDSGLESLQTSQLQRIYNGTYTLGELTDKQQEKVLKMLKGEYEGTVETPYFCIYSEDDETKRSGLAALVNSDNSPTYTFSGYEDPTSNWNAVNTGGTVTISLEAGRDGWGILPNTLVVNLYKCNDSGSKATTTPTFSSASVTASAQEKVSVTDASNKETKDITTAVDNQSYYVTLPSLKAGSYYLLEATGKDENGVDLAPDGGKKFGFKVATSISAPTVSAIDAFYINSAAAKSGGDYKFRISIKDEADEIQTNGVDVTGALYSDFISGKSYVGNYTASSTKLISYSGNSIVRDSDNNYHIDLPLTSFFTVSDALNHSVVFTVIPYYKDANGSKTKGNGSNFLIWLDGAAPQIEMKSPAASETLITEEFSSYDVSEGEDGEVTHTITPNGSWSDISGSGTYRIWYSTDDAGTPSLEWTAASGTYDSSKAYFEKVGTGCYSLVDTEKFAAGTSVSGYYTMSLKPGTSGATWTEISDVSQVASVTSWEQALTVEQGIGKTFRVCGTDLVGNLSAPVGLTGINYDFERPTVTLASEPLVYNGLYYNKESVTKSDVSGKLVIKIEASDSLKIEESGVTVAATLNGAEVSSGSSGYTLAVAAADDEAGTARKKVLATITLNGDGTSDGEWKWTLSATDAAGRPAAAFELTRKVDTIAPAFTTFSGSGNSEIEGKKIAVGSGSAKANWTYWEDSWYSSSGLVFNGNLIEATSGVSKIEYRLTPAGGESDAYSGSKTYSAGSTGTGTSPLAFSLTANGFAESVRDKDTGLLTKNIIYIKATDAAGNASAEELLTINVDQSQPDFAAAYYVYADATELKEAAGTILSDGTKNMTVYGKASDSLSGIRALAWTIGGSAVTPTEELWTTSSLEATGDAAKIAAYTSAEWKPYSEISDKEKITGWKFTLPAASLSGDVYAEASNIARKSVKTQVFTIDKDDKAPTITLNTVDTKIAAYKSVAAGVASTTAPTVKPDGNAVPTTAASVNGTQKLTGSVDDDKSLSSVKIYWSNNADAEIDESRATNPDSEIEWTSSMYNWTIEAHEFSKLNDGKTKFLFVDGSEYTGTAKTVYIKVCATDQAHNQTIAVYEYSVNPESDRPIISINDLDLSAMTSANYVWRKNTSVIRGKVSDDDGLTGLELKYQDSTDGGSTWSEAKTLALTSGAFELWTDDDGTGLYDGKHVLKFTVTDAEGTEFAASGAATESFMKPKILKSASGTPAYFGDAKGDDTLLYISVDTQKPAITNKSYSAEETPSLENSSSTLGTVGGTRNKFNIYFYAYDKSGLDDDNISFTLNGNVYNKANSKLTVDATANDGSDNPSLKGYQLITVSGVDVSDKDTFTSGSYTGTIKVTDKAGMERTESITVDVDNTAPVVTAIAPSETQAVSGNVNAYGTVDGATMYYALSATENSEPAAADYAEINGVSQMWYVYFDGSESTESESHAQTLNQYIISKAVQAKCSDGTTRTATAETIADHKFDAQVPLWLWVKAVDSVGNETTITRSILLDPQGNRPEVSFSYPDKENETLGGEIKIYGGAKAKDADHPTIQAVFAQIVSTTHSYTNAADRSDAITNAFVMKAADWNYLQTAGYQIYKMDGYSSTNQVEWNSANSDADAAKYGILASVSGSSWSLKVNNKTTVHTINEKDVALGELDPVSGTNVAAIRVFAYDGKNLSESETRTFKVDADSPVMTTPYLKQFGNGTDADATASQEYKEGIYVKGKWYFTFSLTDGQGIGAIKIGKGTSANDAQNKDNIKTYLEHDESTDTYTTPLNTTVLTSEVDSDGHYKEVNVKYPLDTDTGVGTQYIYVWYCDLTEKGGDEAAKTYKVSFDNAAPVLAGTSDSDYSIPETVQQSNGWYSLGSKVSEPDADDGTKQSGFERLAFYFTRGTTDANRVVFDPMISKKTSGAASSGNRVKTSGLTFEDGLYWKKQTVTRDANSLDSITITADPNIHVGGLVKLGGVIYRISGKTSDTAIQIDGQPEAGYTDALFAIANVVDNTIQESSSGARSTAEGYGFGYNEPSNDDGDLMIESVVNSGTDWKWNANIYSKNIADGPVQIHYVAFDKAGNYSVAGATGQPPVVEGTVSNNRPRIANLYVGTDLDGNNAVDGDPTASSSDERKEWTVRAHTSSLTWNEDYNSGTATTEIALGTATKAAITAKGMTKIRPEILGGNGNLYYGYKITNAAGTSLADGSNATAFITGDSVDAVSTGATDYDTSARDGDITIQVGDWTTNTLRAGGIPDCAESAPHSFVFTFYDQTEDATGSARTGIDSSRSDTAKATIYMAVAMTDSESPVITREELFWNGAGESDDEGNANNSVAWNGDTPLGHIELSDDLPAAFTAAGAAHTKDGTTYPSAVMDRDAKVSGKIILRGTVSDNKMLYNIYLKVPQMAARFEAAGLASNATYGYKAATYNASSGSWTMPVSTAAALSANGIQFAVTNNTVTSSGHSADWEFIWDTSYITNVAAANVTVDVYASDQVLSSAVSASGAYTSLDGTTKYSTPTATEKNVSAAEANHPATLQVDVVPYITGLTTYLSAKGAAYARTAKGHWPVWYRTDSTTTAGTYATSSENWSVQGFNFTQGNGDLADQTKTESGPLVVTVNSVPSLNNINNNDAALNGTDYANAYNRQPNGKNNNLLTDNVYIDIWQLNGKAAVPDTLKIETPTMKINPNNGAIGFAFRYGTANKQFAMPNGNTTSYTKWHTANDIQNSVTFNYDSNGATYGTVAGGESGSGYTDRFSIYTSLWGVANGGNGDTEHRVRLEITGQSGTKKMDKAADGTYTNSATGDTEFANEKTKHQSPSIATAGTHVYLAYYDSFNQELRFRSSLGSSLDTGTKTEGNKKYPNGAGNFVGDDYNNGSGHASVVAYSYKNCQIVAQANTPAQGGEHVSIAAMPNGGDNDDAVAMVWYDAANNKMWYSYNSTPSTDRKQTINTQLADDAAENGWTEPVAIFGTKVSGEYCKVAFDKNGKVHIAAFDSAAGDIWYAYLDNPATASGAVICRVDSDGTVGENLTLDVALDADSRAIPVLGYYNASRSLPKFARPAAAGTFANGVSGGKFTGAWEVTCVPTNSKVEQDNINVGVWKTADGVLKESVAENSYYGTDTGVCYGNGTKNAVLGYRYTDSSNSSRGYIETAQLTGTPDSVYQDGNY